MKNYSLSGPYPQKFRGKKVADIRVPGKEIYNFEKAVRLYLNENNEYIIEFLAQKSENGSFETTYAIEVNYLTQKRSELGGMYLMLHGWSEEDYNNALGKIMDWKQKYDEEES